MKAPGIGEWRSDEARRRFVEMEDQLWSEHWPRAPIALDLESFAGTTRVYRWPGDGEAVVFLHGMGATGLSWSPYVERLAGRDVYAVDTIGDVGRSEQREVIADAAGLANMARRDPRRSWPRSRPPRRHLLRRLPRAQPRGALAQAGRIVDPDRQRRARSLPLGPVHAVGDADAARIAGATAAAGARSHEPVRCSRTRA